MVMREHHRLIETEMLYIVFTFLMEMFWNREELLAKIDWIARL